MFAQDNVISTASKIMFDCFTLSATAHLKCHSPIAIYLFIYLFTYFNQLCSRCSFDNGVCKNIPYKVQILEILDGNGRTTHGTSKRKLNIKATAFSYELNVHQGDDFIK